MYRLNIIFPQGKKLLFRIHVLQIDSLNILLKDFFINLKNYMRSEYKKFIINEKKKLKIFNLKFI